MEDPIAEQEYKKHQKTHPVSLGFASAAGDMEELAKKHTPHPAPNSLLRKAGEKRGGVKHVFYSYSLSRLS